MLRFDSVRIMVQLIRRERPAVMMKDSRTCVLVNYLFEVLRRMGLRQLLLHLHLYSPHLEDWCS